MNRPDDPKSVDLLYDVAKKLLDDQNRDLDTMTTRAGVVFGFSTLVVSGAGTVLGRLGTGSLLQTTFGAVITTLYSVMAWNCARALLVRKFKSYPSPTKYKFLAKRSDPATRKALLRLVAGSWKRNSRGVMKQKAQGLAAAIHALGTLVAILVFATILPFVGSTIADVAPNCRHGLAVIVVIVLVPTVVWIVVRMRISTP